MKKVIIGMLAVLLLMTVAYGQNTGAIDPLWFVNDAVGIADADSTGDATQARVTAIELKLDTLTTNKAEYIEQMAEDIRDSLEDANDILQAMFNAPSGSYFLASSIDHVNTGVFDDAATSEVFDVTGNIEFWLIVYDSTGLVSNAGTDSFNVCIALTASGDGGTNVPISACLTDGIDAGEFIPFYAAASAGPTITGVGGYGEGATASLIPNVRYHGISMGRDIGMESDAAITSGITRWLIWWRPLSGTAAVAAGAGGAL